MSVDVFGRTLKKTEGTRGPPGAGYKFTRDGHFDVDSKRLCNLAAPVQPTDAVNFQTLKDLIGLEIRSLYEVTKRLRSDIDDLNILLNTHKVEADREFQKKFNVLTDLVKTHRDEIDRQILEINNRAKELKEGIDYTLSGVIDYESKTSGSGRAA